MSGHRRSIRLPGYDYASPGSYYVTLLTHLRACVFGRIIDGEMRLSAVGEIARDCWLQIPDHVPGVRLDSWVIMPNHLHAILAINGSRATAHDVSHRDPRATHGGIQGVASATHGEVDEISRATHGSPLLRRAMDVSRPRGAMSGSLGAIIGQYKGASGRRINRLLGQPGVPVWHRDYHDHVIRHEDALNRIRRYIDLNPSRWYRDRNNPDRRAHS